MSSLSIAPDLVAAASGNLENLGSALRSANAAAASQTTAIAAPAADEVSAAITALFGAHAQEFQALSAKAAAFHDGFVNLLSGGAAQYVSSEAANAGSAAAFSLPLLQFEEALTATGTIKTPFGPLTLLTANGSATVFPDGALQGSLTARVPLLPRLLLSFNGTPVSSTTGFEEALTATGGFKTPFGPLNFLTANGTATIFPDGALQGSLTARVPLLPPLSLSFNGTPVNPLNLLTASESATSLPTARFKLP
jgi:hypothetical protein